MEINLNFLNGDNTSSKLHTYWKALPVVAALFAATQDLVYLSGEKKKQKRFYRAEHLGSRFWELDWTNVWNGIS